MARGSVYKRNNSYGYRADLGPDPATGRRRQMSKQGFRTKKEAEAALGDLLSSVRAGSAVSRSSVTVGEYLADWLIGQRQQLKATTWASYGTIVERIDAKIGSLPLQGLRPKHVEDLYRDLGETGGHRGRPLSPKTVRNTHTVLRKALADAERLELLPRNPAAVARPPADDETERVTWSSDELRDFFSHVADDRLYALWILFATTGMRRGEALGLRWRDVDLDSGDLRITQTIVTISYTPQFDTPKTKRSRRSLYLDPTTVDVLRRHRVRQKEERLALGEAWMNDRDLVFTDELGRPLHPDKVTRAFRAHVREADLRSIRLHDLRHTYATLALKAGVHPKVVSDRLGHATTGITLDLYSHVTPGIGREAADLVADRIFGTEAG